MIVKKKRKKFLKDPRFSKNELKKATDLTEKDDRNLVGVDDAFRDADVEDKVWLFWQRNKNLFYSIAIIAILAVVTVQGLDMYRTQQTNKMQAAYSQITDPTQRVEFAKDYADQPLGGVTFLELADHAYAKENYSAAAKNYKLAQAPLSGTIFESRAKLGYAMAEIKDGQSDKGIELLKELANNSHMLEAIRAEAAYNVALIASAQNNNAEARKWIDFITHLQFNGVWQTQADMLAQSLPKA